MAGAPVPQVVGDRAEQHRDAPLRGHRLEAVEQGGLAVVAAGGRVGDVAGVLHLCGPQDQVAPAAAAGQLSRGGELTPGERGGVGGDRGGARPQHVVGDLGDQGAVDPAGEGDEGARKGAEDAPESFDLGGGGFAHRRIIVPGVAPEGGTVTRR